MKYHLLFGLTAALGLLGAACGGKVFIDLPGGGSGGGAGGSTSTSSGEAPAFCVDLCQVLVSKGCADDTCKQKCADVTTAAPECLDEISAHAACLTTHIGAAAGCVFEPCSNTPGAEYEGCVAASSCDKGTMGSNGEGGCVGKGICANGVELGAECDEQGDCVCFSNTSSIGSCHETGPFLCDFFHGCCALFLGTGG